MSCDISRLTSLLIALATTRHPTDQPSPGDRQCLDLESSAASLLTLDKIVGLVVIKVVHSGKSGAIRRPIDVVHI